MFMWKMITPLFRRLPGYLWIAFVLGLFVGASSLDDNYLTLPRMFTFYPFFLLGMDLDRNRIDLLRARIRRILFHSLLLICAILITAMFDGVFTIFSYFILGFGS